MDKGYIILLLLVLVYGSTAAFLYLRARRTRPGPEESLDAPAEGPESP